MVLRHVLLAAMLWAGCGAGAAAREFTVLTLNRDLVSDDCVLGPVTIEHDELAWAVERSWQGNKPLWGKLIPGSYSARAIYREGAGIELTLAPVGNQPVSVLVLTVRPGNGVGQLAIGREVVGNCRVESGTSAPAVARRLAQRVFATATPVNGQSTTLKVRVDDR